MSQPDKRLAQVQRIAAVLAERALMPVAAASATARRIEARIAEIAAHRAKLAGSAEDPTIAGTMLSQAERLRIRQAAALSELAAARVQLENARRAAAQAVGRDRVLAAMIDRQKQAAALKTRRNGQT